MTCVKPERTWSKFGQSHVHKLETKYWTLATCIQFTGLGGVADSGLIPTGPKMKNSVFGSGKL
jgi:hypothetical protein